MNPLDMVLPMPSFVVRDTAAITAELIAQYESLTGKTLYPAQIERVLIDLIAYRESLLRVALQDAALQNLVRYARAPMLDHLGENVGTVRTLGEDDEAYRARILLAPAQFAATGSAAAYRYWAMSADASIIDVAVESPTGGTVDLHPLVRTVDAQGIATIGLPSAALLAKVLAATNNDTVRPVCDTVAVLPPIAVPYDINAQLTLYTSADDISTISAASAALESYAAQLRGSLGNDIVRNQIIGALQSVAGVYDVVLVSPAADRILALDEWANCTNVIVSKAGIQHG